MAAISPTSGQNFDFIFKLHKNNCRPHVMVCLNLVHNKAEEELLENDGSVSLFFFFFFFWSDYFREF